MKILKVKRKSKFINIYHKNMGLLKTKKTSIYLTFFSIKIKCLHEYRETYYGEIKSLDEINLAI